MLLIFLYLLILFLFLPQIARSLIAPLSLDIAGDPDSDRALGKQRLSVAIGVLAGAAAVILVILLVVTARQCGAQGKNGYEAGKKEPEEDFFSPSGAQPQVSRGRGSDRGRKPRRDKRSGSSGSASAGGGKSDRSLYSGIVTVNGLRRHANDDEEEELSSASDRLAARYCVVDDDPGSPRMGSGRRHQSSPDLARHYKSSSPLPAVNLQPHSPPAEGKKHQAVQDLPPSNTFVGSGGCVGSAGSSSSSSGGSGNADAMSLGSDQCSEYGCHTGNKYNKQVGTAEKAPPNKNPTSFQLMPHRTSQCAWMELWICILRHPEECDGILLSDLHYISMSHCSP